MNIKGLEARMCINAKLSHVR